MKKMERNWQNLSPLLVQPLDIEFMRVMWRGPARAAAAHIHFGTYFKAARMMIIMYWLALPN